MRAFTEIHDLPSVRIGNRQLVHRLVLGSLLLFALGSSLPADGLSRQDLIDMRRAGVDAAGIVKLVNARGLSFFPTSLDLLDFKTLGFDVIVINALAYRAAADLYRAGKYEETVSVLESHLSSEPQDHVSRALLGTAYLRLHKRDLARQELEHLKAAGSDGTAVGAGNLLQNLIAAYDSQAHQTTGPATTGAPAPAVPVEALFDVSLEPHWTKETSSLFGFTLGDSRRRVRGSSQTGDSLFCDNDTDLRQNLGELVNEGGPSQNYRQNLAGVKLEWCTAYPTPEHMAEGQNSYVAVGFLHGDLAVIRSFFYWGNDSIKGKLVGVFGNDCVWSADHTVAIWQGRKSRLTYDYGSMVQIQTPSGPGRHSRDTFATLETNELVGLRQAALKKQQGATQNPF